MNVHERRTNYPTFTREEFIERIRCICGIPDEITGAPDSDAGEEDSWSLRDDGRNQDGTGESYAERNH